MPSWDAPPGAGAGGAAARLCVSVSPRLTILANVRLQPAAMTSGTFGLVEAR